MIAATGKKPHSVKSDENSREGFIGFLFKHPFLVALAVLVPIIIILLFLGPVGQLIAVIITILTIDIAINTGAAFFIETMYPISTGRPTSFNSCIGTGVILTFSAIFGTIGLVIALMMITELDLIKAIIFAIVLSIARLFVYFLIIFIASALFGIATGIMG
ncbi:MAG: hypothetical protein GY861_16175 [bacterium]|nr:hypothetical protein [bacterium]